MRHEFLFSRGSSKIGYLLFVLVYPNCEIKQKDNFYFNTRYVLTLFLVIKLELFSKLWKDKESNFNSYYLIISKF